MKIVIGCDEAGCGLKHIIIDRLQKEGIEVTDEGCRDEDVYKRQKLRFVVSAV